MNTSFKAFSRFQELFTSNNIRVPKKYIKDLQSESLKWWKDTSGAIFGSTTRIDTKSLLTWHYSIGMLTLGIPSLGDYHFKFVIKMYHFQQWKVKEWQEGFKYGKYCSKSKMKLRDDNYRDANPYKDSDFYRNDAWDAGYIMGLSNFKFKNFQP